MTIENKDYKELDDIKDDLQKLSDLIELQTVNLLNKYFLDGDLEQFCSLIDKALPYKNSKIVINFVTKTANNPVSAKQQEMIKYAQKNIA